MDTRNAMRNACHNECTASEEQFEKSQRRATTSDSAGIGLATLRRSFRLGRAMLVTTVSDIGDNMIFACIRNQAQIAVATRANISSVGANVISRTGSFEGCRNFFLAQIRGVIKLGKMLQALQPNWKQGVASNGFDRKLAGVDQQLLTKYIKRRVAPILKRLEQAHAWNMADAVQQLVTCINLGRGAQTKHPSSIVE